MTLKYVPTTAELDATKETEITLSDSDYMLYSLIKELIKELNRFNMKLNAL